MNNNWLKHLRDRVHNYKAQCKTEEWRFLKRFMEVGVQSILLYFLCERKLKL